MNIMAIIPARGGSKGVPNKNIKLLNGLPLIAHTVIEGKKSKFIDRLVVSTDSSEIADTASEYGAEIPFMRPAELALDNSKAIDAYIYTINRMLSEYNYCPDAVVVLQPTSPLRTHDHIDEAIQMFLDRDADSVVSVCAVEHSPFWYKCLDKEGHLSQFIDTNDFNFNRQELPEVYRPNGAIYVFKTELIRDRGLYYTDKSYGYIMNSEASVDIDSIFDFKIAELLMQSK